MSRRLFRLLYSTEPFEFGTEMSCGRAVAALQSATSGSVLTTITHEAATGTVTEQKVILQRTIPFIGNSFKPVFVGRFSSESGKTFLRGVFTMHWSTKVFISLWFGFGSLWTLLAVSAAIANPTETWFLPLAGLGMMFAGLMIVRLAKWLARNDQQYLHDVISKALS